MKMKLSNFELSEKRGAYSCRQGMSRKEIAIKMNIEVSTVDVHIRSLHQKTDTHSLAKLALWQPKKEK